MPKEIEPSSYECDCGYVAHFFENTVREVKERSRGKKQWLSEGAGLEKHIVVFRDGKMTAMLCPKDGRHEDRSPKFTGKPWRHLTEVKKNAIVVHEANDMSGLDRLARDFGRRPLSDDDKRRFASYMALMRFVLMDKKTRAFVTERFCFRGSIDDWIPVGGPGTLASQVRQFVKHLGRESFYELF